MVGTKQVKHEDGKLVKPRVVVENIMDAWNRFQSVDVHLGRPTIFHVLV